MGHLWPHSENFLETASKLARCAAVLHGEDVRVVGEARALRKDRQDKQTALTFRGLYEGASLHIMRPQSKSDG